MNKPSFWQAVLLLTVGTMVVCIVGAILLVVGLQPALVAQQAALAGRQASVSTPNALESSGGWLLAGVGLPLCLGTPIVMLALVMMIVTRRNVKTRQLYLWRQP